MPPVVSGDPDDRSCRDRGPLKKNVAVSMGAPESPKIVRVRIVRSGTSGTTYLGWPAAAAARTKSRPSGANLMSLTKCSVADIACAYAAQTDTPGVHRVGCGDHSPYGEGHRHRRWRALSPAECAVHPRRRPRLRRSELLRAARLSDARARQPGA